MKRDEDGNWYVVFTALLFDVWRELDLPRPLPLWTHWYEWRVLSVVVICLYTHTHTLNRENYCQTVIRIFSFIKSNINQSDWGLPKNNVCLSELPVNISCMAGLLAFPAFCSVRVYILYFIFLSFVHQCSLYLLELAKLGEAQLSCGGPDILQVLCFWELAGSLLRNRSTKCTFCVRVEIL